MEKEREKSLLEIISSDRNLLTVCLAGLIFAIGSGAVWFVLPTIASKFTADIMVLIILLSIPYFLSVFMSIPLGGLSDYVGRKAMGLIGIATLLPVGILLPYASDFTVFLGISIIFGFANALLNPASKAYVMDLAPKGQSSEYFGFLFAFIYLGASLGPLAAGLLMADTILMDLGSVAVVVFFSGLVSLAVFSMVKESVKDRRPLSLGLRKVVVQDKLFIRAFKDFKQLKEIGLLIVLVTFVTSIVDGITWTFEPLFYEQLSLDPSLGGAIMFLFVLPLVLFQIPAGYLADKHGKFKVLAVGMLIAGISLVGFGMDGNEYYLMMTAFFTALGVAFAWPALSGIVTDYAVEGERGDISGVWTAFMDIPNILAPLLGGVIVAFTGDYGAVFWSMGLIILLSLLPVILIGRRNHFLVRR
jgi:MFS family permease